MTSLIPVTVPLGGRLTTSPSLGAIDREARWARQRPLAHAAGHIHHVRSGCRRSLQEVQLAARHADPRTTTVYDHRRQNFDKHAAYVVVAFVAGG